MTNIKFLTLEQVKEITSISTASIYRLMANDEFPQSISIFGRRVAWLEHEINAWTRTIVPKARQFNREQSTNVLSSSPKPVEISAPSYGEGNNNVSK